MKKTISINIAGLIFYIEEEGYDKLRQYLASVHRYFSTFEDNAEIIADIESRIAERFLQKQKQENKQAIAVEDVEELIRAMGSVSDFEAAEQAEDLISEPLVHTKPVDESRETRREAPRPRRFFRDLKRKIAGGVAAGIAHYYAIDPLWVRLILILIVMGMVPINGMLDTHLEDEFAVLSGILILAYIAMWIAFPGSTTLEDTTKVKKFYRDPENKVLGGVASGMASYFNLDPGIVRFFWVISLFFFGTGIIIYILLWAIAPLAKTLTEKMEMQGEPITLSNIESNIKRNLKEGVQRARQSDWKRIILLPFIILGKILNALGKVFRELGPVIRVLAGLIMVLAAASALFTIVIGAAALLGFASLPDFGFLPPEFMIIKETPGSLVISILGLIAVPVAAVLLLGLMLMLNRKVVSGTVWIVLAGLFVFSVFGTVSLGLVFQRNFMEVGEYVQHNRWQLGNGTLRLDQEGTYSEQSIDVRVFLKGGNLSDSLKVEKRYIARGGNHIEARETAAEIDYDLIRRDSTLFFPAGPLTVDILPYRMQSVEVILEIPYNHPFAMTRDFYFGYLQRWQIDGNLDNYDLRDRSVVWENLRWKMSPDSGLVCLNFPPQLIRKKNRSDQNNPDWTQKRDFNGVPESTRGEFVKQFVIPEFTKIEIGGAYHIQIRKGDEYSVAIDGSEANVEALKVAVEEGILKISRREQFSEMPEPGKRIGVVITLPVLEAIDLSGSSRLRIDDFSDLKEVSIKLSGSTMGELTLRTEKLNLDLTGVARMLLRGETNELKSNVSGDCLLKMENLSVKNAQVTASGLSEVYFGNVEKLDAHESGESAVYVQGRRVEK